VLDTLNSWLPPTGHMAAPNALLDIMEIPNNVVAPVVLQPKTAHPSEQAGPSTSPEPEQEHAG